MDNYEIAKGFSLLAKLMDIHGDNTFKAKSYSSAAFNIEKLPDELETLPQNKIFELQQLLDSDVKDLLSKL